MADYPNIDKQTLDLIKYPPLFSPDVIYGEDTNYSSNNLRGKRFQFCYRYKYDTKMKSAFSPYSQCLIPQGEELPNGDFIPDFRLNNYIAIKLELGHFTVDKLEVAYRIGNEGTLYVFDTIDKFEGNTITGSISHGTNIIEDIDRYGGYDIAELKEGMILKGTNPGVSFLTDKYIVYVDIPNNRIFLNTNVSIPGEIINFQLAHHLCDVNTEKVYSIFRNDKVNYAVPSNEAIKSFDAVPLTSGSFEIIESNRIVVGNNKTGFPNIDINAELSINNQSISDYHSKFTLQKEIQLVDWFAVQNSVFLKINDSIPVGSFILLNFSFTNISTSAIVNIAVSFYQTASDIKTASEIAEYLVSKIEKYNDRIELFHSMPSSEADHYNFKCATLEHDQRYYVNPYDPFSPWPNQENNTQPGYSSSVTYYIGGMVSYNGNNYVNIKNSTDNPPSGSSVNNQYWEFFCSVADKSETVILRANGTGTSDFDAIFRYTLNSYSAAIYVGQPIYQTFKHGHKQNFAIEYFDYARRSGSAQHNNRLELYVPHLDELPSTFSYNNIINSATLKIKNKPPEWAYAYNILIDKNTPWFFQFFFYGMKHTSPDISDDNVHYNININRSIQNLRDYFPKSILSPYLFEKGDRIRLIAYKEQYHLSQSTNRWQKFVDVMDAEIIGYDYPKEAETYMKDDHDAYILDASGNKIRERSTGYIITEKFNTPDSSSIPFNNSIYVLYQIYRPKKVSDENTTYWETYKTFEIGNPTQENRYHKGNINQDPDNLATTPAEITLDFGNVYRKMRFSGEANIYFPVESMHSSDYYESDAMSIGRANAISDDTGQFTDTESIMCSEKIFSDTNINELNVFNIDPKRRWKLQSKYGPIRAFKEKGFILYAFQDLKVTSLYLGRVSLINPDGTEDVKMLTDSIFGTIRPSDQEFGCMNPESVSLTVHHCIFWDQIHSSWCRIAYNGIIDISGYGQNKLFSDINSHIKLQSNKRTPSVYDRKYDEIIVSHRYFDGMDYNLSVIGLYTIGDNKLTSIGRIGVTLISSITPGMVLTEMTSTVDVPVVELVVLKVDIYNRIIYFDRDIPFPNGTVGPLEITANIYKRYELITRSFHESVNGWKTGYPFNPEFMIAYGDNILSFICGKTYIHNSDNVPYGNFYGIQFNQWIQFPWNTETSMVKLIEGIEYLANKSGWGAIAKGDITVKSFDERGMDMESMLPAARFRNVEGKHVSELLRDMNTPGFTNESYALVNGRFLRGQASVIKLTIFETVKTVLYEVSLYFNQSL